MTGTKGRSLRLPTLARLYIGNLSLSAWMHYTLLLGIVNAPSISASSSPRYRRCCHCSASCS